MGITHFVQFNQFLNNLKNNPHPLSWLKLLQFKGIMKEIWKKKHLNLYQTNKKRVKTMVCGGTLWLRQQKNKINGKCVFSPSFFLSQFHLFFSPSFPICRRYLSFCCLRCALSWAIFNFDINWPELYSHDDTSSIQFSKIGIENTVDINNPLLSKYCWRENVVQCRAANSLIVSEKYTNNTVNKQQIIIVNKIGEKKIGKSQYGHHKSSERKLLNHFIIVGRMSINFGYMRMSFFFCFSCVRQFYCLILTF